MSAVRRPLVALAVPGALALLGGALGDSEPHGTAMILGLLGVLAGMSVLCLGLALWVYTMLSLAQPELSDRAGSWAGTAAKFGFWVAFLGLCVLAGHYLTLTVRGNLALRWTLFWPSIIGCVVLCAWGVHRKVVTPVREAGGLWLPYVRASSFSRASMLRVFVDEVVLQKDLLREDRFRWFRHILIYWGFVGLFLSDLSFAFVSDFGPIFGLERFGERSHLLRKGIDLSLDFFGLLLLVGLILALVRIAATHGKPGARYSYVVTTVFLFVVVVSGFLVEGIRLYEFPPPEGDMGFGGWAVAKVLGAAPVDWAAWWQPLWIFHALASAAFIAYIPFYRLVHCFAVPAGKLIRSQRNVYRDKLEGTCRGFLGNTETIRKETGQ